MLQMLCLKKGGMAKNYIGDKQVKNTGKILTDKQRKNNENVLNVHPKKRGEMLRMLCLKKKPLINSEETAI